MTGSIFSKKTLLATLGYVVSTFALAVVWHIGLFEAQYQSFGYFDKEPDFVLGLLTIVLQGVLLSGFYAFLLGRWQLPAGVYVGVMGGFFWTSHVLAFVAKQEVGQAPLFIAMESFYLLLQFGCYGLVLWWVYRRG